VGDCSDARACSNRDSSIRILLYSHDSWGLGHLRRNLTLATALVDRFPSADVVIATGSPCATQFPLAPRIEVVKLPSISKNEVGAYVPRTLGSTLNRVLAVRRGLLFELWRTFAPHLLVVDHQVLGLNGEIRALLADARQRGTGTILGLRDIVDAPSHVVREWDSPDIRWAFEEGYDRICVYGDSQVFDTRSEYRLPACVAARTEFTGYVVRERNGEHTWARQRRHVLVTMGGGEDGSRRIERYLEALATAPFDWETTIVTGPLMGLEKARAIKRRAAGLTGVQVRRFHGDLPHLMRGSSAVVAMCGYNVSAEILQSRCPAIFLPRVFPRAEQLVRATRLSSLGLSRYLVDPQPDELRAQIEATLERALGARVEPSLDGCRRFCDIAADVLGEAAPASVAPDASRGAS
jgi:predicted glycosyltransferase